MRSASQFAETSALLESCKNGLAPLLLENKMSLSELPPTCCGQTWKSCFWLSDVFPRIKNVVSIPCQHISMNTPHLIVLNVQFQVMKYLYGISVIFCILNMPRSSYFRRIILKTFLVRKKCGLINHMENIWVPFLGMWSQCCSQWIYSRVPPDFSMNCRV